MSFASLMCVIFFKVFSSTIGCPVGVNRFGFHPKSIRYSPICLREPRLNSCRCFLMKGFVSFVATLALYSSSLKPTLDRVPSAFSLGVTSLSSTHLGLNVACTSSTVSFILQFRSARRSIAFFSSNIKPFSSCC